MVKGKKTPTTSDKQTKLEKQHLLELEMRLERLKQLESSSSTTSDTDSEELYISQYEDSVEDGTKILLENLYDTDTESLHEEEPEYVQRKTLEEERDFFQVLKEVPNVDNISEDISVISEPIEEPVLQSTFTKDMGKFVNPLTGLDIRQSSESVSSTTDVEYKKYEDLEEEEAEAAESFIDQNIMEESKLLLPTDTLDLEEDARKLPMLDDTLETFLELYKEPAITQAEEIDWEALAQEEEAKRLQRNTLKFINELINKVVEIAEYVSPEKLLRQNLDKRKLILELIDILPNVHKERSCCTFLNRQVTQHFKRKQAFRFITEDNPQTLLQYQQKLYDAKKYLDEMLSKESKLRCSASQLQEELRTQYKQLQEGTETEIEIFENIVRRFLCRDSMPKLNVVVDKLLFRMKKYRQEVSEVRLKFFLKQHTQARLIELSGKLEDLGNGLSMKDFNQLQAETQALDKKIEERNAELSKLYTRCRNDVHTLAHYKEKQQILCSNIRSQRCRLENLLDDKLILREHLYSLKMQRSQLHSQIKKLSAQGGLLDKPALMVDYDRTIERCREQQNIVNYLKQTLHLTQIKIDDIVKHCSAMTAN